MKVLQVFTSFGETVTVGHGCAHGDEIASVVVDAEEPVYCDVCEELITEDVADD